MKNWKRKLAGFLAGTVCVAAAGYATRDFWRDQYRIYLLGNIEVAAIKYGRDLPEDIDTVDIFTLSNEPDAKNTNGFFGDFAEPLGTLGHMTLSGDNARKVAGMWRHLTRGRDFQAMCFEPVYGLQFKRGGKIYYQTSVCWHCSGYTLPLRIFGAARTVQHGFAAKSEDGRALLGTLQSYLPLPPEPVKTAIAK